MPRRAVYVHEGADDRAAGLLRGEGWEVLGGEVPPDRDLPRVLFLSSEEEEALEQLDAVRGGADAPLVLCATEPTVRVVQAALRYDAIDLLRWPDEAGRLVPALARGLPRRRRIVGTTTGQRDDGLEGIVGASPPMRSLFRLLERVAPSDATVVITGETGTGKELVARALHRLSPRKSRPFIAVNCSAVPDTLLESELFGHVRGAFTDARSARAGLVQRATGGTLFLDEIAEMPALLQPKLLRALQERTLRPVGSDEEIPFDVRFVAASNTSLEAAVADGRLREDLYYRLSVINLELPPLRERGADVLLLAETFLHRAAERTRSPVRGLSRTTAQRLLDYRWPGNVRELQNCIERSVALAEHDEITVDDLPRRIRAYRSSHVLVTAERPSELVSMDEVERRYIRRVLAAVGGNRQQAARILGFDRKTLYRKLKRYALEEEGKAGGG